MADPFDALRRAGDAPRAEPDAAFRARLMRTVRAELGFHSDDHRAPLTGAPVDVPADADAIEPLELNMDAKANTRPARRSRAVLAALAAAALIIAAVVVLRRDRDRRVDTIEPSPTTVEVGPVTTTAGPATDLPPVQSLESAGALTLETGISPSVVSLHDTTLWVVHDGDTIDRYDAATGVLLGTVPIKNGFYGGRPGFGFGSMWIATMGDDKLWRVDAATGEIQASLALPGAIGANGSFSVATVAVAEDVVWVLVGKDEQTALVAVDPSSNRIARTIAAPSSAINVAFGFGSLWIIGSTSGTLTRIDPAGGAVQAQIELRSSGNLLRTGFGSVWVSDFGNGFEQIRRIDPTTNTIVASIAEPPAGSTYWRSDFAFGGGFVWTSSEDTLLMKIDPSTNRIVARYGAVAGGGGVAASDDEVWVSGFYTFSLARLPLR